MPGRALRAVPSSDCRSIPGASISIRGNAAAWRPGSTTLCGSRASRSYRLPRGRGRRRGSSLSRRRVPAGRSSSGRPSGRRAGLRGAGSRGGGRCGPTVPDRRSGRRGISPGACWEPCPRSPAIRVRYPVRPSVPGYAAASGPGFPSCRGSSGRPILRDCP